MKLCKNYNTVATFEQIKEAVNNIPDCNEEEIIELRENGIINQSEYEELLTIIHNKNNDFKTAPYNNYGYYRQQGPLYSGQVVAKKNRLRKIAEDANNTVEYQYSVQPENKQVYYVDIKDNTGNSIPIDNIQGLDSSILRNGLLDNFNGLVSDDNTIFFIKQEDAQSASDWIKQQIDQVNSQG